MANSFHQKSINDFLTSPVDVTKLKPLMTSTPINQAASNSKNIYNQRKRRIPLSENNDGNQMILDLGQKLIGMTNCSECGMVYSADDVQDRKAHENFHNRFTNTKFFKVDNRSLNSWKKNFYNEVHAGKVNGIIFKVENKKSSLKTKLENVIKEIVDIQLGICDDVPVFNNENHDGLGFVFVADAINKEPPFIGAVAMTHRVQTVKLMPLKKIYKDSNKSIGYAAVERLWVHPLLRRKKLASHILDVILRLYSPPSNSLLRSRIAFVDPNPTGIEFAKAYLNKNEKWIQIDGDENTTIENLKTSVKIEKNDEIKKSETSKVKKEVSFDYFGNQGSSSMKKIKIEKLDDDSKENILPPKKAEAKNNPLKDRNVAMRRRAPPLKPKEKTTELYRTLVIDENSDESSPIQLELMPKIC